MKAHNRPQRRGYPAYFIHRVTDEGASLAHLKNDGNEDDAF